MLATRPQQRRTFEPVETFRQNADLPWGIRSLRLDRDVESMLAADATFDDVVGLIADRLAGRGLDTLVGASPLGHRLAAAIANRIAVGIGLSATARTAVIDGVTNTGIQMAEAWRQVVEAGSSPVVAIALVAQHEVIEDWGRAGRTLEAIEIL